MLPTPVTQSVRHWNRLPSRYRNIIHFLVFSIILGAFVHVVRLGNFDDHSSLGHQYSDPDLSTFSPSLEDHTIDTAALTRTPDVLPDSKTELKEEPSELLSLEEIRDMVASTKGFLARDFSLGLGWNNMRYIIEASSLQAKILNRTLILPSFVYARACEYDISVCADYFPMVNRGDAIGWDEWRSLPIEQQMGFRIPISVMMNITLLRQIQPVILLSDYLRLHGLTSEEEKPNGAWHRDPYNTRSNVFTGRVPSLYGLKNHWYDPPWTIRVDALSEETKRRGQWRLDLENDETGPVGRWDAEAPADVLSDSMAKAARERNRVWLEWNELKDVFKEGPVSEIWDFNPDHSDEALEEMVSSGGWEVVHTFRGTNGQDLTKTVVDPIRQVVPRSALRGLQDEFGHIEEDVLLIEGELHLHRKPGSVRFTSSSERSDFASMVLDQMRPPNVVYRLAEALDERMKSRAQGRTWMGAHMRRGDFVRLGWAMSSSPEDHVKRVKEHLTSGRKVLENLSHGGQLSLYAVPHVEADWTQLTSQPPLPNDPFYVATDERDPEGLKTISSHGAIFLRDIMSMEDQRIFGFELMLTDVRALVEQALLARAGYMYAHGMSSLAGGVVNMRAAGGKDVRTVELG